MDPLSLAEPAAFHAQAVGISVCNTTRGFSSLLPQDQG